MGHIFSSRECFDFQEVIVYKNINVQLKYLYDGETDDWRERNT